MFRLRQEAMSFFLLVLLICQSPMSLGDTKWDMPTAYSSKNFHTENLFWFVDRVEELTGGSLQIKVHPSASLYVAPDIFRAVRGNQVEIGEVLMALLENQDTVFGVDNLPFLARTFPDAKILADAQKPWVQDILAKNNMIFLFSVPWPPQGIYTSKPIRSLSDFEGMKFRAYSRQLALLGELLGARPMTIQSAEVAQALAIGKIDSLIASSQSGVDYRVWESLTYYYDFRGSLPKNMIVVNMAEFKMLTASERAGLVQAAQEAEERGWKRSGQVTLEANNTLIERGIQIRKIEGDLRVDFEEIGRQLIAKWLVSANEGAQMIVREYSE